MAVGNEVELSESNAAFGGMRSSSARTLRSRTAGQHSEPIHCAGLAGYKSKSKMANPLASCVSSLRSTNALLSSSISILDSGVNDFPRLAKVLQTTRVRSSLSLA